MTQSPNPSSQPALAAAGPHRTLREPIGLLLGVLLLWNLASLVQMEYGAAGLDYYQFWAIAQLVHQPHSGDLPNIYSDQARQQIGARFADAALRDPTDKRFQAVSSVRRTLQTFATPFLYTVFVPLALDSYSLSCQAYHVVCVAATAASVLLLCRLLAYGWIATILAFVVLTQAFEPFQSQQWVLNVNPLQLASLALFLDIVSRSPRTSWHDIAGGAVLGLSLMFKPNLAPAVALPCLLWLIDRHIKRLALTLLGIAIGAALAVGISSWQFGGVSCWIDWLTALRSLEGQQNVVSVNAGNCSLPQWASEHANISPSVASLALGATLLAVCAASMWRSRLNALHADTHQRQSQRTAIAVGLGAAVALLAAPLSWVHYFLLAVPLILCLLRPSPLDAQPASRPKTRPLVAIALLALCPLPIAAAFGWNPSSLRMAIYPIATLALLIAGLRDLSAGAPPPTSSPSSRSSSSEAARTVTPVPSTSSSMS
jgi:hypothetical protein